MRKGRVSNNCPEFFVNQNPIRNSQSSASLSVYHLLCFPPRAAPANKTLSEMKFAIVGKCKQSKVKIGACRVLGTLDVRCCAVHNSDVQSWSK